MAARTTLEDYRVRFEALRRSRGMEVSSLNQERSTLKHLCRAWDRTRKAPGSLDMSWMEDYLFGPEGRANEVSVGTFNKKISHIKSFMEWLIRRSVVRNDVLDVVTTKKGYKPRRLWLPLGALHQMIDGADDPWEKFVLEFGVFTLGRWSELCFIQMKHVHLDAGRIDWWREKTDEWDRIPIMSELDTAIRRWVTIYEKSIGRPLTPDDYLVPMRKKFGWSNCAWQYVSASRATNSIRLCVKEHAAPLLGGMDAIRGQGVHLLRRSAARELYEALKRQGEPDPLRVVMAMLGHKNIRTTELYLGIERDRETRDTLLAGRSLLGIDKTNVVELKVASG
ncbi:site-specific integrase [Lentzea sp. NBRC 102530]|uniref:tyrosine-type recombinase/integrase n=1 Tax=Lentzea sp. NBRC 102530 TaxID=3032201 RepID=UPI0024A35010|nr:site-specific integrase [Lentzea sp. NBRC 102530]GLY55337.1 hypothetical protein Lesp01_89920 [Lentzea sp. NBRC 102530]